MLKPQFGSLNQRNKETFPDLVILTCHFNLAWRSVDCIIFSSWSQIIAAILITFIIIYSGNKLLQKFVENETSLLSINIYWPEVLTIMHAYSSPTYMGISQPPPHSIVRLVIDGLFNGRFLNLHTSRPSSLHYLVTSLILTCSLWESKVRPAQWQHCITVRHISCYLIEDLWRLHFSLRKTNSTCWISNDTFGTKGFAVYAEKR